MRPLLTIVIPCLNEKETIRKVVVDAKKNGQKYLPNKFELIVADNGSTDGTIDILNSLKDIRVIRVPVRGYGAALHWGIMKAKGEYVFFADADLSYDFSELKKFIKYIGKDNDLVLGSRLRGKIEKGAMPILNRYLGTPVLTVLIRLMYGIHTTDCNSGMRLVRRDFYKTLHMRNSGMEWASELLLKTALAGGKYKEVPINFFKDKRNLPPHLSRWSDGWRHLKAIVLVKPNYLFYPLLLFVAFTIYLLNKSFDLTFFFGLLSGSLFLSILAAKMLNFAIDNRESRVVNFVNKFPLPMIAIITTIIAFSLLLLFPNTQLTIKLFIASVVNIFNIWVFLIETIKTHLIKSLPEKMA